MSDFLAELQADLTADSYMSERSQQTETGASDTYQCRAYLVMNGNNIPPSDPRLSWAAFGGSAYDKRIGEARQRQHPGLIVQQRFTYRGVTATVDELEPPVLRDWKSKAGAAEIATVRRDGPHPRQVAQVHLGAAGAVEAGFAVDTVQLVFFPREGDLADGWVWEAPFDRQVADEAVAWHEKVRALREERRGLPVDGMVDGLRDKPAVWCRQFCDRVGACRGPAPVLPELDQGVADFAAEYAEAMALEAEGKARKEKMRPLLLGLSGQVGGFEIRTSGGRGKTDEVLDTDALVEHYRFVDPDAPLPMRLVESVTPVRLTVKRAKP